MNNPTLKVKVLPRFPSSVSVSAPLALDTTGGNYAFSIDLNALEATLENIFLQSASVDTISNKTIDNSNIITLKDANFTLQDDSDATKQAKFQLSGIATATTRTWTFPDANDTFVGNATAATLTNKTIDTAGPNTIKVNGNTLAASAGSATVTLPNSSDTLVGRATADTFTGVKTFNNSKLSLAGSTSGNTLLNAAATASGTLTLPAATDTLIGKATTDTLTNKTFDSAGTGNVMKVSSVTVSAGQYPATATNDNATAGNVGEYVPSSVARASPVSLTTSTPANLTSITLGAGDWDVSVVGSFTGTASAATILHVSLSTTSATEAGSTPGGFVGIGGGNIGATDISLGIPPLRFSLSGSTTIFAVVRADFGSGTVSAWGLLSARRRR